MVKIPQMIGIGGRDGIKCIRARVVEGSNRVQCIEVVHSSIAAILADGFH